MYVGLGIVCCFASLGLWPVRILGEALCVCAVVCFVGAIAALPGLLRSRYDLGALREVHERETVKLLLIENPDEPAEFDSIHCLNCGEVYNLRIPICPSCGYDPRSNSCG
jgi:hypothetical protein